MTDQIPTQIPPSVGGASVGGASVGGASVGGQAGAAPPFAGGAAHATSGAGAAAGSADLAAVPARPAGADATAAAAVLASTWQYNKKVSALWSINQNCNSWVGIEGLGWRKLFSGIETSTMALTIIVGSALVTQGPVSFLEESDGMIHELYAF